MDKVLNKYETSDLEQICPHCTEELETNLDEKLRILENQLKSQEILIKSSKITLHKDSTKDSYEELQKTLNSLLDEENIFQIELERLYKEQLELEEEEKKYWELYHKVYAKTNSKISVSNFVKRSKSFIKNEEVRLNDRPCTYFKFSVVPKGQLYETSVILNELILARHKNPPTPWDEINSGLGQAMLLLKIISKMYNINIVVYKLLPMGRFSKIEIISTGQKFNFYYSDEKGGYESFNNGLKYFLKCVNQVKNSLCRIYPQLIFDYRIDEDNGVIGSDKIIYQDTIEWSNALKRLMHTLKKMTSIETS